ncbi:putative metal-binding motif-containing protein [Myxococcota bacterium]|nr:putative metal-binding motif-containing protein [Myxococcota bacterium]
MRAHRLLPPLLALVPALAACSAEGPSRAPDGTAGDGGTSLPDGGSSTPDGGTTQADGGGEDTDCPPQDWYADQDGDGWGDSAEVTRACAPPEGWVDRGGDCDDADPDSFPGALDSADGRDQDCDGVADDQPVDLVIDPAAGSHLWLGLGAHAWVWDDQWPTVLEAIGGRVVRASLYSLDRPDSAPAGGTAADFDAWLLEHDTAFDESVALVTQAQARGLSTVALVWEVPPVWESSRALDPAHVQDQARLVAAMMARLDAAGARPDLVELLNEPDGDWNSYAGPATWADLVLAVRDELDARGLEDLGVVGPGLAFANNAPAWIDDLPDTDALAVFSTHLWDDAYGVGDGVALTQDALDAFLGAADALDPGRTLPRMITEAGSKDTALYGVPTNPADSCGDVTDLHAYAVRALSYTLLAAASGAGSVLHWQAADMDWGGCWGTWGLVDASGAARPTLDALALLGPAIPEGAVVVPPRWRDPELAVAAFATPERVVLALANPTAREVERALGVDGAQTWTVNELRTFSSDGLSWRDPLDDGDALRIDGSTWIDGANATLFGGDQGRLSANDEATVTWSLGADLTRAEARVWAWGGIDALAFESSTDGEAWTALSPAITRTEGDWELQVQAFEGLPAGTRHLRARFLPREVAWTPQLGQLDLELSPGAPVVQDHLATDRRLLLTLPPDSALVVVLDRR